MQNYFADLHIHIGMNEAGQWVKMATSRRLTLANILHEGRVRKGMDLLGIVDALSPRVQQDLENLIQRGELNLLCGGGYRHCNGVTLLPGAEFETAEEKGQAHWLAFFPDLAALKEFSRVMACFIKNINLSSQNCHVPIRRIISAIIALEGIFLPAHAFTPHKSAYGSCATRLGELLPDALFSKLAALELGLSADSFLADRFAELADLAFLSNSDAHSAAKIGREYNILCLKEPSFHEVALALKREQGRHVAANYGLDPRLGKYHRTHCLTCGTIAETTPPVEVCPACHSAKNVRGVLDRIVTIADYPEPVSPAHRPPYHYQMPLEFIPGLGKRTLEKLLRHFGTEMAVLHFATEEQLTAAADPALARRILLARRGAAAVSPGGGGKYGRMK